MEFIEAVDLPQDTQDDVGRRLADYTIAFIRPETHGRDPDLLGTRPTARQARLAVVSSLAVTGVTHQALSGSPLAAWQPSLAGTAVAAGVFMVAGRVVRAPTR